MNQAHKLGSCPLPNIEIPVVSPTGKRHTSYVPHLIQRSLIATCTVPGESSLDIVGTIILWEVLEIMLLLGYLYFCFLCFYYCGGAMLTKKAKDEDFLWKHRIETGFRRQLLAISKTSVCPQHLGRSQCAQCWKVQGSTGWILCEKQQKLGDKVCGTYDVGNRTVALRTCHFSHKIWSAPPIEHKVSYSTLCRYSQE